jgi:uncharacterized membrane protein SpoIIM required for sporulation
MLRTWRSLQPKIKRILTIIIFLLLSLTVTVAGVLTPLSTEEQETLNRELDQIQEGIKEMDLLHSTMAIFTNNFLICLIMFVPIVGQFFGLYVLYNTGLVIAAVSLHRGYHPLPAFLSVFILPFGWMEFVSYSIALSESSWLLWSIVHRRGRKELMYLAIMIGVCGLILLGAAFIEAALIAALA